MVRDRKFRTALRTNQIIGFVTVPAWKKIKWFMSSVLVTESNLIFRCSGYRWDVSVSSNTSKRNQHRCEGRQLVRGPQFFSNQVLPDWGYTLQKQVSTVDPRVTLSSLLGHSDQFCSSFHCLYCACLYWFEFHFFKYIYTFLMLIIV